MSCSRSCIIQHRLHNSQTDLQSNCPQCDKGYPYNLTCWNLKYPKFEIKYFDEKYLSSNVEDTCVSFCNLFVKQNYKISLLKYVISHN